MRNILSNTAHTSRYRYRVLNLLTMKLNKDDRREEMAAYGTMFLISVIVIAIILATITTIFGL